jgi:hypothetical protein
MKKLIALVTLSVANLYTSEPQGKTCKIETPPKTLALSQATHADVPIIFTFLKSMWSQTYDWLSPDALNCIFHEWNNIKQFEELVESDNGVLLQLKDETGLHGIATGKLKDKNTLYIGNLYLDQSCQRQKWGTNIIAELKNKLPQAQRLEAIVQMGNKPGEDFFKKHGFTTKAGYPKKFVIEKGNERFDYARVEKNLTD